MNRILVSAMSAKSKASRKMDALGLSDVDGLPLNPYAEAVVGTAGVNRSGLQLKSRLYGLPEITGDNHEHFFTNH